MVDGGRIVAPERELASGFEGLTGSFGDAPHAPLDHVEHPHGEGPDGTLQFAGVWHYVGGFPGLDHGDRDYAGVYRAFIARNNGLERLYDLASHRYRIDAVVWHRRVRAFAVDSNLEFVAGRKRRPGFNCKLADLQARPVVRAKDRFHREQIEQAILDHLARTAAAFLGRLKDQVNGAVEIAVTGQVFGGGQQHGDVTIMAAGVHLSAVHTRVSERVVLRHRQRVDVSA